MVGKNVNRLLRLLSITRKHNHMAFSHEFQRYRSVRPFDMLQSLVVSILLHSTLLIGSKYWLRAFMPEPKQEIPIEVVEVYPNETHIPQKTSFRATKDSIAGGKALPKRPVSVVKSANRAGHKASVQSPFDLKTLSPLKVFQSKPGQQKAESPNLSPQQPQPKPKQIASAPATTAKVPNFQKVVVAPMTTPPPAQLAKTAPMTTPPEPKPKQIASAPATTVQVPKPTKIAVVPTIPPPAQLAKTAPMTTLPEPKPIASAPATTVQVPKSTKIAVAPMTTPPPAQLAKTAPMTTLPEPKPKQIASAPATTVQVPKPTKIAVVPTIPPPAVRRKTAMAMPSSPYADAPEGIAPTTTPPAPKPKKIAVAPTILAARKPKNLGQRGTLLSGRTPISAQSSVKTGAASLLGGTFSVSSRNFSGDLAALPNSNRDNQGTSGIDASSQDIDITSYLNQLQQQVKQQWLPGASKSSRRTVLNFTVNRSGKLSNLQLAQTSGFSVTDQAALNAIQRSAPFAPLPTGYPKKYINIQFTFDINIYGELNLSGDGG